MNSPFFDFVSMKKTRVVELSLEINMGVNHDPTSKLNHTFSHDGMMPCITRETEVK